MFSCAVQFGYWFTKRSTGRPRSLVASCRVTSPVPGPNGPWPRTELCPAESLQAVVQRRVHVRKPLVSVEADVDVIGFNGLARLLKVGSAAQRVLHCGFDVHGHRDEWRKLSGFDLHRPEVWRAGIEDERAECVFGVADIPFRDDDRLLTTGHFRFGRDDVDGRRRADFDSGARVAQRLVGQIERLPLHAE